MVGSNPQRLDRWILLVAGGVCLAVALAAIVREATPAWAPIQEGALREIELEAGRDVADRLPHGLQQLWIPALRRTDRCVTCHVGVEGGAKLEKLSVVARAHPRPELLAAHPIETFGCTLCHGGQGAGVTVEAAHGEVEMWDEPLLGRARAKRHGLDQASLLEAACNACHRHAGAVAAMPRIAQARALVKKSKCVNCHRIDGRGGAVGPDLGREGDKSPDHLVFPVGWSGPRTALAWHTAHFLDPKRMSPGSEMPQLELTEDEARSLALLVTSWRALDLPPAWTPGAPGKDARR